MFCEDLAVSGGVNIVAAGMAIDEGEQDLPLRTLLALFRAWMHSGWHGPMISIRTFRSLVYVVSDVDAHLGQDFIESLEHHLLVQLILVKWKPTISANDLPIRRM